MSELIKIRDLSKVYDHGLVKALSEVSLSLESGKFYALKGSSGCGKSTLLNLIGTLDCPSSGDILYKGKHFEELGSLPEFRRHNIGFVFQFHHLIPVLTLRENVESALLPNRKISSTERNERATNLLKQMGVFSRADSYATEISGGERQRGAIARALMNEPRLLLADEPTGNVDSKTAHVILKKLKSYIECSGATMLIATHDPKVSEAADVIIEMEDGRVKSVIQKLIQED